MKWILTFALLLAFIVLAVPTAAQQSNARIAMRCGVTGGLGFVNPVCGAEAGGTVSNDRVALDVTAHYLFARKRPGGGHNVGGEAVLKIGVGDGFYIGPAAGYSRQTTNQYIKSAWDVGVEGGVVVDNYVLSARFLQDLTSVNKGRRYAVKLEHYGPKHLYFAGRGSIQDFRCNQTAAGLIDHCLGASGYVSVGFYSK